jgi:hypothetical protein
MQVTIRNWEKFHPRKDVKQPTWFACSNRMVEDDDFYSFDHGEFKAWLYILSKASQKSSGTIFINLEHAERISRISPADFRKAALKLVQLQIITVGDTDTSRERHADVTPQTDRQTDTQGDSGDQSPAAEEVCEGLTPADLMELWNKVASPRLARVSKLTPSRTKTAKARIKENPDPAYWLSAVEKINKTPFLLGIAQARGPESRVWRADFEWFLRPDSLVKLFEGKYDR